MGKKMVVLELGHPLYLGLHVHVYATWKGHWLCSYVCHVLQQKIHVETFGWLEVESDLRNVKNDGPALRIMKGVSTLGTEIFGQINDADTITSLVQNVGRNILGMHISL